ncbi:hypothetical protein CEXT_527211 [Caerostris extrusa]|uniref:Uncharacterized protein n=1 Tax=Caerostris extrusa TaxID=172846 RepID=A0AAV4RNE7_CAEEX|nr:hypothetical protein CEXT_527211 [Caerostris extrusa]
MKTSINLAHVKNNKRKINYKVRDFPITIGCGIAARLGRFGLSLLPVIRFVLRLAGTWRHHHGLRDSGLTSTTHHARLGVRNLRSPQSVHGFTELPMAKMCQGCVQTWISNRGHDVPFDDFPKSKTDCGAPVLFSRAKSGVGRQIQGLKYKQFFLLSAANFLFT